MSPLNIHRIPTKVAQERYDMYADLLLMANEKVERFMVKMHKSNVKVVKKGTQAGTQLERLFEDSSLVHSIFSILCHA